MVVMRKRTSGESQTHTHTHTKHEKGYGKIKRKKQKDYNGRDRGTLFFLMPFRQDEKKKIQFNRQNAKCWKRNSR